jgi:magnesium transporter
VIVDCAVYEEGRRRPGTLDLEAAFDACRGDGAFVWLGLASPTEKEFDAVAREFDLHELAVEDAIHAHQRPKVEPYGETLFVVLKTTRYVDKREVIEVGEIQLFVNPDFVVSVRHGEASGLAEIRQRVEKRPDLLALGPATVLHAIVDHVVDDYDLAAHGVEVDIQEVEDQVFSPKRSNPAARIYYLEREVIAFQRAVTPLVPAVDRLSRGHFDTIPKELHEYFRDVRDHLLRASGRIQGFRDLLASALHANLTQVSVRQNEDMRRISAWVAILAVPTMIAAIYGMNFDHMPELHWRFGYLMVLVLILIACGVLYRRFKQAGWL